MIREFLPEDLAEVMDLWLVSNQEAHSFIPASYWQDNYELVRELLPKADLFVYQEEDGAITGFIGLQGNLIAGLFVAARRRSQGIGKQLLDVAKSQRNLLYLQVYQDNEQAVAFYLREGFQLVEVKVDEGTGQEELHLSFTQTGTVENFQ